MAIRHGKQLGRAGEEAAAAYLRDKAYRILERNYRWARGEIDIVAEDGDTLVFVEVKTARSDRFGPPEGWVDRRKQAQLGQVALHYLQEREITDRDCRFDVVAVRTDGRRWRFHHIENAFWLEA